MSNQLGMNESILEWLGGHDIGLSSKAIALTALGKMPRAPNYPHDGDDFGRCYRLLKLCPGARIGLDKLAEDGGPVWAGLILRWSEIEAAYLADEELYAAKGRTATGYRCYELMQAIINHAEN